MVKIDAETQVCLSLSARPGGFGVRFHNYLYGELKLNYAYRSSTTPDLRSAIAGLRALRIRGCGLSMPYKEQVLEYLDEVDPAARAIGAVNTIVNEDVGGAGRLIGYNTDCLAVREQLRARRVGHGGVAGARVALLGSGGMARACARALADLGCKDVTIYARNRATGERLAAQYEFTYADVRELASAPRGEAAEVLINATPIGMAGGVGTVPSQAEAAFSFPLEWVRSSKLVVESVANPPHTPLVRAAREAGVPAVVGFDLLVAQGAEQFRLYTGVSLRVDQIGRAAVYARGLLRQ